jgi:sortase (surface protein transpeptidase)
VVAADVLDRRETWVAKQEGPTRLTLVTCYPFDAPGGDGPLRYVVVAALAE